MTEKNKLLISISTLIAVLLFIAFLVYQYSNNNTQSEEESATIESSNNLINDDQIDKNTKSHTTLKETKTESTLSSFDLDKKVEDSEEETIDKNVKKFESDEEDDEEDETDDGMTLEIESDDE